MLSGSDTGANLVCETCLVIKLNNLHEILFFIKENKRQSMSRYDHFNLNGNMNYATEMTVTGEVCKSFILQFRIEITENNTFQPMYHTI